MWAAKRINSGIRTKADKPHRIAKGQLMPRPHLIDAPIQSAATTSMSIRWSLWSHT
jgi:hypothetical protein